MKKTLTINLGGTVYHIDEDAYRLLDNYLSNLKYYFRKQEGADEIVDDIEMRISELFAEKVLGERQVVTITDVEEIIARVGKPEDFGVNDDEIESERTQDQSSTTSGNDSSIPESNVQHRLYRDPDNKLLGGVAAGIAAYFGWDITLTRILMILLFFVPYCPMIILYLVGWIVIPEARTAAEKLSMRGEAVTIENIGRTVTDGFEKVTDGVNNYVNTGKPRSFMQKIGDVFVSIAAILFKIFLIALVILCFPVLFVLALILVALVFSAIAMVITGGTVLYELIPAIDFSPITHLSPLMTFASFVSGVLLIGIPIGAFMYTISRHLFHWEPMNTGLKWTLFLLWIVGAVLMIINLSSFSWPIVW